MESPNGCTRSKAKNASRQMWGRDEDAALLSIVQERGKSKWGLVAEELRKRLPQSAKTGKQCRERYRNYLDPLITKKEWTKSDKAVFLLLHSQFGNRWGQIAKYFLGRSDISLKNLFYSFVRRALRALRDGAMPTSTLTKPRKILESYYVVDVIQNKYLPAIQQGLARPNDEKNEKILLTLIKEKSVTPTMTTEYKQNLVKTFKESNAKAALPFVILITTDSLNLADSRFDKLKTYIAEQNFGELSSLITVRLSPDCGRPKAFPHADSVTCSPPPAPPPLVSCCETKRKLPPLSFYSQTQARPTIPPTERLPPIQFLPAISRMEGPQSDEAATGFSPPVSLMSLYGPCAAREQMLFWPMLYQSGTIPRPMVMPPRQNTQGLYGSPYAAQRFGANGGDLALSYEPDKKIKREEMHE